MLRAIDIRSEAVVRLLSDFLDTVEFPHGAEHFCHELYSYLRSPYRKLKGYDEVAQICHLGLFVMICRLTKFPSTILYHLLDHQFARRRQQGDVLDLDQSLRILHTHLTLILFYHPRVQSVLVLVYPIATDHLYPDILPLLVDVPPLGLDHPRREVPVRTMRINMITPGIVNPPEGEPGIESLARTKDGNIQVQEEERKGFDPMSWKGNVTENGP